MRFTETAIFRAKFRHVTNSFPKIEQLCINYMAAVRGFSLAKLVNVRISFSVFDGRATSARCAAGRE